MTLHHDGLPAAAHDESLAPAARPPVQRLRSLAVARARRQCVGAALACAGLWPQWAMAACPPSCVTAASVVNAAGVPEDMARITTRLEFNGIFLAGASARTVKELAAEFKRLPPGATVTLRVGADSQLGGPAAATQAAGRQQSLQKALAKEGVKAQQVTVAVAP